MHTDWSKLMGELRGPLRDLRTGAPDVMKGFSAIAQAATRANALDQKTKELIALAIAVALMIAWSGYQILRQSIPVLVDERAIDANQLRGVVLSVSHVKEVRQVRSRSTASGQLFAEVTIVVAGSTPVEEAHHLADQVEAAIEREFGASQVTVHVEPT